MRAIEINRKTLFILMVLILTFLAGHNIYALASNKDDEKIQHAKSAFNEIIELWYEQKFDSLYDKFADRGKSTLSKEKFISRMTNKKKKLACCWQKFSDMNVKL